MEPTLTIKSSSIRIVFTIWIGGNIKSKFLPRLQSLFIEAHRCGYKCIFYTDNITRLWKNLYTSNDSLESLISIINIHSINKLLLESIKFETNSF